MQTYFATITHTLWNIYDGFTTLGRLHAIKTLALKQINEKILPNKQCQYYFQAALKIAEFMQSAYAKRAPFVYWYKNLLPTENGILNSSEINLFILNDFITDISNCIAATIYNLNKEIENNPDLSPITLLLSELNHSIILNKNFPSQHLSLNKLLGAKNEAPPGARKAMHGPVHVSLDDTFIPSYSLLETTTPAYGNTLREAAPYYWGLSARECLASDMCALTLIEYDGLPINFYVDMAKQAHDEIRHAALFLEAAKSLLPQLKNTLHSQDELYSIIERFEKTGSGLPIPLEKNLYETMWNTTLEERFILMHHDTETPGIQRLREKIESEISQQYISIANKIEIAMREEVTHARIGDKWLKYLLPNPLDRANAIKHARLMRSILILTASAHYHNQPLSHLINNTMLPAH